ncbi:MAG TPA: 1-deoxy-D-xylulose-5-phosphate synthase [Candidatus Omnitrophota bacterium]|nr:1-deoxy-D-xylulose-5-phosphate synthase [Candidatus Omnitrophota bacterium]HPS19785.1 1-deoxy-D-xylulose-5-phosphate synthase [Candidatus Omnitrophota bacterium]
MDKLLDNITSPGDLKKLSPEQLSQLAMEVRERIIYTTAQKGGHLAASLGVVELAIALHYCLDSPKDKIIWDVGHQAYAHKILTGRNKNFDTLREMGGLSGFPNKNESEHDPFTSGHSATSISSALGMAKARDLKGETYRVVAVIGDASLSTGLAFEGLNHAGHMRTNLTVVLNDNTHAISRPVGAMSKYLTKVLTNPLYNKVRDEAEKVVKNIPRIGQTTFDAIKKFQEGLKNLLVPGILFEELGFRYIGPIDGHDFDQLLKIFKNTAAFKEPVIIHVITKKGKGYKYAEDDPTSYHGVFPFDVETGAEVPRGTSKPFTWHFGKKMLSLAEKDKKILAITAAMKDGVGLAEFAEKLPNQFFDVGINEPHAVTFAAGLARGGFKPVIAVYSTFLQRSYDQIIHDVSLQDLPVIFCVDRAGLVGKDGPTHHGMFDIAYFRHVPHFVIMAPKDGVELEMMLEKAVQLGKPVAIRYPRDYAKQRVGLTAASSIELGKSEILRDGNAVTMVAVGSMVNTALDTAEVLYRQGIHAAVINARFIKPLDSDMIIKAAQRSGKIVTMEEGVVNGGFGGAVLEALSRENIKNVRVRCLGLPDEFIEHGAREELFRKYHLTPDEIAMTIKAELF